MRNSKKNIKFLIFGSVVFLFLFNLVSAFSLTNTLNAVGGAPETSFGGKRYFTLVCTCSTGNYILYVDEFVTNKPTSLLFSSASSKQYRDYNLLSSTYVLGTHTTVTDQCLITVSGSDCEEVPADYQIGNKPGIGTSAL